MPTGPTHLNMHILAYCRVIRIGFHTHTFALHHYSSPQKTKTMTGWIVSIVLGAVAGWLGGMLYRGSGLGLLANIIIGILGGVLGYWIFGLLGISLGSGWLGYILTAAIGAALLLAVLNLFGKARK